MSKQGNSSVLTSEEIAALMDAVRTDRAFGSEGAGATSQAEYGAANDERRAESPEAPPDVQQAMGGRRRGRDEGGSSQRLTQAAPRRFRRHASPRGGSSSGR